MDNETKSESDKPLKDSETTPEVKEIILKEDIPKPETLDDRIDALIAEADDKLSFDKDDDTEEMIFEW